MIKPTIGRIVWYYPPLNEPQGLGTDTSQPLAAIVCYVRDDHNINIAGFSPFGEPFRRTNVYLVQPEDEAQPGEDYACWMPFQIGAAKKYEQEERETAGIKETIQQVYKD